MRLLATYCLEQTEFLFDANDVLLEVYKSTNAFH